LKSANAFQCNDLASQQSLRRFGNRSLELRAADGTGIRLRVKAAIGGIPVLFAALRTEHEIFHRGVRAIVGYVDHDGVARAAVGAIRERILEAPVSGIEQFVAAILARSKVGEHVDRFSLVGVARVYLERSRVLDGNPRGFANRDHGSFGAFAFEAALEQSQLIRQPFYFRHQSRGGIQHPTGEPHFGCQAVDEGAESHALHGPLQGDPQALRGRFGGDWHRTMILGLWEGGGNLGSFDLRFSAGWRALRSGPAERVVPLPPKETRIHRD